MTAQPPAPEDLLVHWQHAEDVRVQSADVRHFFGVSGVARQSVSAFLSYDTDPPDGRGPLTVTFRNTRTLPHAPVSAEHNATARESGLAPLAARACEVIGDEHRTEVVDATLPYVRLLGFSPPELFRSLYVSSKAISF